MPPTDTLMWVLTSSITTLQKKAHSPHSRRSPCLILHAEGHVGIYIGGGYAIEAMGTRYGVVKTRVANRNWTGWCKSPYIAYVEETTDSEEA